MKKVTELTENDCIHCVTEADAIAICKLMHESGLKWAAGRSYLTPTNWESGIENMVFYPKQGTYAFLSFAQEQKHTIYPVSVFLEPQQKVEIKLIQMKKITEFTDNEVIHCPTEAEAIKLCKLMHFNGMESKEGLSYLDITHWGIYKDQTCYRPKKGIYCYLHYYQKENYTIYPASEVLYPKREVGQLWMCVGQEDMPNDYGHYSFTEGKSYEVNRLEGANVFLMADDNGVDCYLSYDDYRSKNFVFNGYATEAKSEEPIEIKAGQLLRCKKNEMPLRNGGPHTYEHKLTIGEDYVVHVHDNRILSIIDDRGKLVGFDLPESTTQDIPLFDYFDLVTEEDEQPIESPELIETKQSFKKGNYKVDIETDEKGSDVAVMYKDGIDTRCVCNVDAKEIEQYIEDFTAAIELLKFAQTKIK